MEKKSKVADAMSVEPGDNIFVHHAPPSSSGTKGNMIHMNDHIGQELQGLITCRMFGVDKFSRCHVNEEDDHDDRSTTFPIFSHPLSSPSHCPPSEAFFHVIGSYTFGEGDRFQGVFQKRKIFRFCKFLNGYFVDPFLTELDANDTGCLRQPFVDIDLYEIYAPVWQVYTVPELLILFQ